MPNTSFDSELTGEQIEAVLNAIHGVVTPENNGKILAIEGVEIVAKSASEWTDTPVLEPLSVTENGDYTPEEGVDGYNAVHVAVPGATLTTKSITSNGTYNASQDNADGYSSVTVNVPGGAVVQPLSVTENGTYNPPSGVDGFAPVTVNVSGGGGVVKLMTQGQVSTDSDYATATFDEPIDLSSYSTFLIAINDTYGYLNYGAVSGSVSPLSFRVYRSDSPSNYYIFELTSTTIRLTYYSGSWRNIYVDVYGVNL